MLFPGRREPSVPHSLKSEERIARRERGPLLLIPLSLLVEGLALVEELALVEDVVLVEELVLVEEPALVEVVGG